MLFFSHLFFVSKNLLIVFCVLVVIALLIILFALARQSEKRTLSLLSALIGVIEVRDPNLEGHSLHVRNLSMLLYVNLPLLYRLRVSPAKLQYTALLLDIGKLCIPSTIIEKSGKLGKDELDLIRHHPILSENVLLSVKGFSKIAQWIKYHHERIDGGGYFKLQGDKIPLVSRIVAVADTFSALTMERNYKPYLSYEEAISELRFVSGKQLDETLVEYFCSIPLREIEKSMEEVKKQMRGYSLEECLIKKTEAAK